MTQWDDENNRATRAFPDDAQLRAGHFQDSTSNPFGAASNQAFGIAGTVLALLGAILGIVTLTGLEWFDFPRFGGVMSFRYTSTVVGNLSDAPGFASAYFGWLAWVLLIIAVIAAVMASFPSPALRAFRIIGTVVGFAAAGLSFLALQFDSAVPYTEFFTHARIGFYLMVIAYVLVGAGAAIGPRKV